MGHWFVRTLATEGAGTEEGVALRSSLWELRNAGPEGPTRRLSGTTQLQYQAFSVAIRRLLARTPDQEAISGYVSDALTRLGLPTSSGRIEVGIALVRVGLGEEPVDKYLPWDMKLMRRLLVDQVRSRGMTIEEIDAMVGLAERWVEYFGRKARRRRPAWWGRLCGLRYRLRSLPAGGPAADGQPGSMIGTSLKALARFDTDMLDQLPAEPSADTARAVTMNAYQAVVRERYGAEPATGELAAVAEKVGSHLSAEVEIQWAVFAHLVDNLGLYDHELNKMIRDAEGKAEAEGHQLSVVVWEHSASAPPPA